MTDDNPFYEPQWLKDVLDELQKASVEDPRPAIVQAPAQESSREPPIADKIPFTKHLEPSSPPMETPTKQSSAADGSSTESRVLAEDRPQPTRRARQAIVVSLTFLIVALVHVVYADGQYTITAAMFGFGIIKYMFGPQK